MLEVFWGQARRAGYREKREKEAELDPDENAPCLERGEPSSVRPLPGRVGCVHLYMSSEFSSLANDCGMIQNNIQRLS